MNRSCMFAVAAVVASWTAGAEGQAETSPVLTTMPGYSGIWYMNQKSNDEYRYKYSGGFATYPQQHIPMAIYRPEVNKTFFCYGGTVAGKQELLHMVSYFDHATSTVPRPRVLLNKQTSDAHDNPVISMDERGYILIFSPAHGTGRATFLHRSRKPYDIDQFDEIPIGNYSYPQAWHVPGKGFTLLHTRYGKGRYLYTMTSDDGTSWSEGDFFSGFAQGHYQISNMKDGVISTAFNYHPPPLGLNARTNLYYAQTRDMGKTWETAGREQLATPLQTSGTAALVRDYEKDGLLVYLKDLNFDAEGHPVIMYMTSRGYESGPKNNPRTWRTAQWDGSGWIIRKMTTSGSNYDFGSLYIESDGTWRVIAPTLTGPQPYNPGGEVAMWVSRDKGANWKLIKQLTSGSKLNHTYVRRPVNAHQDFYAFWADGHGRQPSESRLYFATKTGDVYRLPVQMDGALGRGELVP